MMPPPLEAIMPVGRPRLLPEPGESLLRRKTGRMQVLRVSNWKGWEKKD